MRGISNLMITGIVLLASATIAMPENMRCGNDYIQVNDSAFMVVEKCGEPISKIHVGYTINENKKRELVIEEWVYGPVKNYYYFVTMIGGHVSAIRSERR